MPYDDVPRDMAHLPRDKHGRPVPWFAAWVNGKPDFRVIGPGKLTEAMRCNLCWVCGYGFRPGQERAWVIGPMCVVNKTTAEPPCHIDCAVWSAKNCPFLATPAMTRREGNLPEGTQEPAGVMIKRNPGVTAVYVTGYRNFHRDPEGLFRLGNPKRVLWFRKGERATRKEVTRAIETGLPALSEIAAKNGDEAVVELASMLSDAREWIPQEGK